MIVATALNLALATYQDIFDYVVLALIQQGEPSTTSTGSCMYRNGDAQRCAAGHLISDAEYAAQNRQRDEFDGTLNEMERKSVSAVVEYGYAVGLAAWVQAAPIQSSYDEDGRGGDTSHRRTEFLRAVQNAHDYAVTDPMEGGAGALPTPAEWLAGFRINARKVAFSYGLDAFMVGYRSGF